MPRFRWQMLDAQAMRAANRAYARVELGGTPDGPQSLEGAVEW